jgi:hypothetical protein
MRSPTHRQTRSTLNRRRREVTATHTGWDGWNETLTARAPRFDFPDAMPELANADPRDSSMLPPSARSLGSGPFPIASPASFAIPVVLPATLPPDPGFRGGGPMGDPYTDPAPRGRNAFSSSLGQQLVLGRVTDISVGAGADDLATNVSYDAVVDALSLGVAGAFPALRPYAAIERIRTPSLNSLCLFGYDGTNLTLLLTAETPDSAPCASAAQAPITFTDPDISNDHLVITDTGEPVFTESGNAVYSGSTPSRIAVLYDGLVANESADDFIFDPFEGNAVLLPSSVYEPDAMRSLVTSESGDTLLVEATPSYISPGRIF